MSTYHDGDLLFKDGPLHLYIKHSPWTDEEYRAAMARLSKYVEAYLRTRKPQDGTDNPPLYGDNPVPPRRTMPLVPDDRWGGSGGKGG